MALKNCVILGSGRSGTSAAAGAVITANPDYFSGGDFVPPRVSNPDGTFEPVSIRSINEDILALSVPPRPSADDPASRRIPARWQRWLARIPVGADISASPETISDIRGMVGRQPFCFKDPRFSYTLGAWRPLLPECSFVCMFRHPAECARSILRFRDEFSLMRDLEISYDEALEAWTLLNRHILEKHYAAGGSWTFIHMGQLFDGDGARKLEAAIGSAVDRSFLHKDHVRTSVREEVPPETLEVYRSLCQLAGYGDK